MTFLLGNQDRILSSDEFHIVYKCAIPRDKEDSHPVAFWRMIMNDPKDFVSGKSKSSAIRNPVLRTNHRALSHVVFARSDSGSVNNSEIYYLYSLLRGDGVMLSHHMGMYWERVARNDSGEIRCGGPITDLCVYYDINVRMENAVSDDIFLTFEALSNMDVFKVDQNRHDYCPQQRDGDLFPLPSPALTRVSNYDNRDNWKMDTPVHARVIAAFPACLPWQTKALPIGGPFVDLGDLAGPNGERGAAMEEDGDEENEGDDDDDDVPHLNEQTHHHSYRSTNGRRPREQPVAEFQQSVHT